MIQAIRGIALDVDLVKATTAMHLWTGSEGNDCLQFQLDCDQHTLEMVNFRSNESHTITGLLTQNFLCMPMLSHGATLCHSGKAVSFSKRCMQVPNLFDLHSRTVIITVSQYLRMSGGH